jgi:uncharacterized protein YndB with AHSA1/START domain
MISLLFKLGLAMLSGLVGGTPTPEMSMRTSPAFSDLKIQGAPSAAERAIVKTEVVAAPPRDVWHCWTTSAGIKEFLGVNSTIELKFGGRYELYFIKDGPMGGQGSEGAQVLSYVPEKMLSFSWNAPPMLPAMRNQRTFVVVTLTEENGKTRVDLRHAGWGTGPAWDEAYGHFDHAWGSVLGALKARFESGPTKDADAAPKEAPKPDMAPLEKLTSMIGGTWRGELPGPNKLKVEFTYKRHPDGKGVVGEGVIGKGSKQPLWVHSQFGWDPVAKAVYYFDTHDSETLYFGHVSVDKTDLVFTFSPVGMLPQVFQSRMRFIDHDTYEAVIADSSGKEIHGFTLKRER